MSEKWGLIRPSCPIFADFFEPKWVERRQAEHGPKVGRNGSNEVRFLSRGWYEGMVWKLGDRMRGLSEQRSRSVWVVQLYVNAGGWPFPLFRWRSYAPCLCINPLFQDRGSHQALTAGKFVVRCQYASLSGSSLNFGHQFLHHAVEDRAKRAGRVFVHQ